MILNRVPSLPIYKVGLLHELIMLMYTYIHTYMYARVAVSHALVAYS